VGTSLPIEHPIDIKVSDEDQSAKLVKPTKLTSVTSVSSVKIRTEDEKIKLPSKNKSKASLKIIK
jgi:hypothetical protein